MNYSICYKKALFLFLLFSYSFTYCIGQERTSLNEGKLKSALLEYPLADYNSDGMLTEIEFRRYNKWENFIREVGIKMQVKRPEGCECKGANQLVEKIFQPQLISCQRIVKMSK